MDADKDYWAGIFLSGFPLDMQAHLSRKWKVTGTDYYSHLQELMAEQTYQCQ